MSAFTEQNQNKKGNKLEQEQVHWREEIAEYGEIVNATAGNSGKTRSRRKHWRTGDHTQPGTRDPKERRISWQRDGPTLAQEQPTHNGPPVARPRFTC